MGLDNIPDALGLCLGFLNQLLELAQLPDLHFQFGSTHGVDLLYLLGAAPAAVGFMCTLPGVTYHIPFRSYVVFLVSTFACPS